jgi:hypothetical protein
MSKFAKEHEDQLDHVNYMRKMAWEEGGDTADAIPRLEFLEIVVLFEARGLCYSKIVGCLRSLVKQGDILCDESVYYAKPADFLFKGTRTRIRKIAEFLPSPRHTAKIPELKIFYHP